MSRARFVGIACAGLFALAGSAWAQSRGELLYTTHCIACHSTQVHWRDQRRATDLDSLKEQVRHWQRRALLSWSEDDILEVTRYLNQTIYRFGQSTARSPGHQGRVAPLHFIRFHLLDRMAEQPGVAERIAQAA